MGLGPSLCRTVVEQHGGKRSFGPGPGGVGSAFSFRLPMPRSGKAAENRDTSLMESSEVAGLRKGPHRAQLERPLGLARGLSC